MFSSCVQSSWQVDQVCCFEFETKMASYSSNTDNSDDESSEGEKSIEELEAEDVVNDSRKKRSKQKPLRYRDSDATAIEVDQLEAELKDSKF